jgi:hypothetical protein
MFLNDVCMYVCKRTQNGRGLLKAFELIGWEATTLNTLIRMFEIKTGDLTDTKQTLWVFVTHSTPAERSE